MSDKSGFQKINNNDKNKNNNINGRLWKILEYFDTIVVNVKT